MPRSVGKSLLAIERTARLKKKGLPGDFGLSIWYVFSRSGPLESTFRFAGAFKGLFEGEVHIRKGEKSA